MLNFFKAYAQELSDPVMILGAFSLGMWGFAEEFSTFLKYFEANQVALTGFLLFLVALVKKIYELKTARMRYLEQKRANEET